MENYLPKTMDFLPKSMDFILPVTYVLFFSLLNQLPIFPTQFIYFHLILKLFREH